MGARRRGQTSLAPEEAIARPGAFRSRASGIRGTLGAEVTLLLLRRPLLVAACLLAPALGGARAEEPALTPSLDLEAGWVVPGRNDVRVPGTGGTLFSLTEGSFSAQSAPYVRVQGELALGRHHLRATVAPLRLDSSGILSDTILFAGQPFFGPVDAHYRLDTYRLTYRYALTQGGPLDLQLGATALLHDAEIQLSGGGVHASKTSVGVVPLASLRAAWRLAGPVALVLDGDAIAAGQGHAVDASLAVQLDTGDLRFRAGYRVIEGRMDTSAVYNAVLFHLVGAGVTYAF
jgi:hypothetical protein